MVSKNELVSHELESKRKGFCRIVLPTKTYAIIHNLRGYSMPTILAFDHIENKHSLYHGKYCIKKFRESLREHAKI